MKADRIRAGITVSAIFVLISGCAPEAPPRAVIDDARPARLHRVSLQQPIHEHRLIGTVTAAQSIDLAFEVSGTLAAVPVREGQTVAAGTLLAALDQKDLRLEVEEAQVQLKLAQQDYDRKAQLVQRGGVPRSVVDDAETLRDLRRVQYAQAQRALLDTRLLAPFPAYVAERYVDNHSVVTATQRILRLNDVTEIVIATSVPEQLIANNALARLVDASATFAFAASERFPLRYREQRGDAQRVGQSYEVRFSMNPEPRLTILPGMSATVHLRLSQPAGEELRIPSAAVTSASDGSLQVWRVDPETDVVVAVPVAVEAVSDAQFRVQTGLADGDLIVAAGSHRLTPGMRVRALNDPDSSNTD
ncbi:MAG: efflux RND transporter periplasmic adaptor subunit [Pseudomonadota bacterium]